MTHKNIPKGYAHDQCVGCGEEFRTEDLVVHDETGLPYCEACTPISGRLITYDEWREHRHDPEVDELDYRRSVEADWLQAVRMPREVLG